MHGEIWEYRDDYTKLAKHIHDEKHHYEEIIFSLLAEKFQENRDVCSKNNESELSSLWDTCAKCCTKIHNVLGCDNSKLAAIENQLNNYAEDIRKLDYRSLLNLLTAIQSEYFNTIPRKVTKKSLRQKHKNLSEEKLTVMLDTMKKEVKIGKDVRKQLDALHMAVRKMSWMTDNQENEIEGKATPENPVDELNK